MKVLIYIDTSKKIEDPDYLKVFANELAANRWFEDNDPLGVAFEYEVEERVAWHLALRTGAMHREAYGHLGRCL